MGWLMPALGVWCAPRTHGDEPYGNAPAVFVMEHPPHARG